MRRTSPKGIIRIVCDGAGAPIFSSVEICLTTRHIIPMTRAQFAMAVRADEKWVENAGRLLSRRFRYTAAEAQWLGLVRILNQDVGLTLNRSAQVADEALEYPPHTGTIVVGQSDDETAGIAIDIARFHSIAGAALAAALDLGGERRRGRPRASLKGKAATLRRSA